MDKRIYVSTNEAEYFIENSMSIGDGIHISGYHKVGDIIISNIQTDNIFGWVCIKEGEPGEWDVIVDLSLIKAAIKELQEKDKLHDELIEALRKKIESFYDELKKEDAEHIEELNNIKNNIKNNKDDIVEINNYLNTLNDDTKQLEKELRDLLTELTRKVNTNTNNIAVNVGDINVLEVRVDDHDEDIDELKNKVNTNTNNIAVNVRDITTLKGRVDGHDDDIDELKNKVNTNVRDITTLKGRVDCHDDDIDELKNKVNTNTNNIAVNVRDITTLKGRVDGHDDDIDELIEMITNLDIPDEVDLTDVIKDINTNKTNISTNKGNINTNTTNINELKNRLDNLDIPDEVDLTDVIKDINTNKGNINTNTTNINELKNRLDNLDIPEGVDLTDVNKKINNNTTDITTLKGQMTNHTHNYAGSSSPGGAATSALTCTGNSATATKLQTARTFTIGSSSKSFDGSGNISWTLSEIGLSENTDHTHNYAGSSSPGGAATSALTCTGNSATATKLQNAKTINGTNFDGSSNITTTTWGTARNITIGNTKKSVNGQNDVVWSLSDIGAANTDHTHNYAGSSSAGGAANSALTCTGNSATATKLQNARNITIGSSSKSFDGSGNISWTLSEIGAANSNHTHTGMLTFWVGTQAQYNALTTKDSNKLYIITD